MTDIIKEWLNTSSLFNDIDIRTDYLSASEEDHYSLEEEQTQNPLQKANIKGTKLRGIHNYTLAGKFDYSVHNDQTNEKNILRMQEIVDWIVLQDLYKKYPEVNKTDTIVKIEVTEGPSLYGIDKSTTQSRYEIAFKITYEREVKSVWL